MEFPLSCCLNPEVTPCNKYSLLMLLCLSNHWCLCPVSDLAPGQLGIDDMKMLEQKAQQLAAEAEQDKPKPKEKILFVRSVVIFSL